MTPWEIEEIKKIAITEMVIEENIKKLLKGFLLKAFKDITSL